MRFDGSTAQSPAHARTLAATLTVAYELASTDAFQEPLLRASLYRLLAITVFQTFRLEGDHQARVLTAQGRQAGYRVASRFIVGYCKGGECVTCSDSRWEQPIRTSPPQQ